MDFENKAMTLTFGDQAENNPGMQKLGNPASCGFTYQDLVKIKDTLDALGYGHMCKLIDLRDLAQDRPQDVPEPEQAHLMVLDGFLTKARADEIFKENMAYEWDKKLWNWKKEVVQNKNARHNVCFAEKPQDPIYEQGKGTIVAWNQVPATHAVARALPVLLGQKGQDMVCEGNLYYNVAKTGIGWHGDSERKKVFGIRFGESIPLKFRWWYRNKSFGDTLTLNLNHGDAYIMSEKAVGWDWGCPVKHGPTLRHSAGCDKYTKVTK